MAAAPNLKFPPGKTLESEISAAMERVAKWGVTYPEGYRELLLEKYRKSGVPYPHILMILGEPRIRGHFFYPHVLERDGPFLDYGCGTGDNIRQLLRDGFPRENLTGFDLTWKSLDLGFDLYRDRDEILDLFIVSPVPAFEREHYQTIYSGSVVHVIHDDDELQKYLGNAWNALAPGGVFFGSTLGQEVGSENTLDNRGIPRLVTRSELIQFITEAGFSRPELVVRPHEAHYAGDVKIKFEFCSRKEQ